jgi:hypothetical protein
MVVRMDDQARCLQLLSCIVSQIIIKRTEKKTSELPKKHINNFAAA